MHDEVSEEASFINISRDELISSSSTSLLELIKKTQEFDLQCRQITHQLCNCSQLKGISLALKLWCVPHLYSVDEEGLLLYAHHVFILLQEALRVQLLEMYHDSSAEGH